MKLHELAKPKQEAAARYVPEISVVNGKMLVEIDPARVVELSKASKTGGSHGVMLELNCRNIPLVDVDDKGVEKVYNVDFLVGRGGGGAWAMIRATDEGEYAGDGNALPADAQPAEAQ